MSIPDYPGWELLLMTRISDLRDDAPDAGNRMSEPWGWCRAGRHADCPAVYRTSEGEWVGCSCSCHANEDHLVAFCLCWLCGEPTSLLVTATYTGILIVMHPHCLTVAREIGLGFDDGEEAVDLQRRRKGVPEGEA